MEGIALTLNDVTQMSMGLVNHPGRSLSPKGDDRSAEWVCPCRCKGSTKWIHQACLQRWLDEKQKGNSIGSVSCPQCGTEYCIVFPKVGPVVYFLQQVDRILSKVSPFAAAGIVVGTLYWSAVTYGAVTSDHLSISRTLCGALVFPTIASLVGRVTFRRVNSNLQRTILQYLIQANRRILNFVEKEDVEKDLVQPEEDSGSEVGLS
ncbi:E3 ubiquitin-protein ligase MARCH5, partial [Ophiophagus hannah]